MKKGVKEIFRFPPGEGGRGFLGARGILPRPAKKEEPGAPG